MAKPKSTNPQAQDNVVGSDSCPQAPGAAVPDSLSIGNGIVPTVVVANATPGMIYDSHRKIWIPDSNNSNDKLSQINYDDVYRHCFTARDSLLRMANKYRQKVDMPSLDVGTPHSWAEVDSVLQSACSILEAEAKRDKQISGSAGKLKRAFRSLCQHAGAGQTFVSVIPSDAFGFSSVVCGGLKVIFTAMYQNALYREEVYKALEDLPYILTDHTVHVNVSSYEGDDELHRRTASLYVAVFKVLEHLLGWFVRNSFVTGIKLLVDPSGFSERLKEKLAEVKLGAQRWERRALTLSMQNQDKALQLQYWNSFVQSRMARDVQTILSRTEGLEDRIRRTSALESLEPFLQIVVDAVEKRLGSSCSLRQNRLMPGQVSTDVLERFLYEPEMVPRDCAALVNLLARSRKTILDRSRIASLQSNPRVRAWLAVDESSLLLVNGRTRSRPGSETSVVCAQIVQHLLSRDRPDVPDESPAQPARRGKPTVVVPLAFFCGQHRDWLRDPNASPAEAAMSLLLQLVDRCGSDLPGEVLSDCLDTSPEDVASVCSSLEKLIQSLNNRVIVVLVLDGLRFFAQPAERQEQMRELVERLLAIYRKRTAATLKFLLASPTRSVFAEDLFGNDEILTLPRDLPKTTVDSRRGKHALELISGRMSASGSSEEDSDSESDHDTEQSDEEF